MLFQSAGVVALFTSFVAAQTTNNTIDPSTVDPTTRSAWCNGQLNTCGTLCDGNAKPNECDPATFIYNCTCVANNSEPGLQYYQITLPTYLCEQVFANCDAANANNKAGKDRCAEARRRDCGTLNPENYTAAPSTTSASSTSATSTPTSASTSASQGVAAPTMASSHFGTGVVAAGVAAAFGLLL